MKITQKISKYMIVALLTIGTLGVLTTTTSYAADYSIQAGADAAHGTGLPLSLFGGAGVFTTITNTLLFIIGALSVIMLIYGGLRYTISGGNSSSVTAAKNTILYAIVGIIVAMLAYAIINFVLTSLVPGSGAAGMTNV